MENSTTVRIDMQKLQMLNDRLCQTLEALNQVRLTAHNIAPAGFTNPQVGLNPHMGTGMVPWATLPVNGYPQFAQPGFWGAHGFGGMPIHTGYNGYPIANHFGGQNVWGTPVTPNYLPMYSAPVGHMTQPYFGAAQNYTSNGYDHTRTNHIGHQQPIW